MLRKWPGRWLPTVVGTLSLFWVFGGVTHTLAADKPHGEREDRREEVVIVKPNEAPPTAERPASEKIDELQRAIEDERSRKHLLELKLKSLRERVETEKRKIGQATSTSSQSPTTDGPDQRPDPEEAVHTSEGEGDSQVVREYIWVPEHREGEKVIEGGYRLKVR